MTKLIHLMTHKTGTALILQKKRIKAAYHEDNIIVHVCRKREFGPHSGKWKCNFKLCDWSWPALEIGTSAKKRRASA
jgi:hypothetical protein